MKPQLSLMFAAVLLVGCSNGNQPADGVDESVVAESAVAESATATVVTSDLEGLLPDEAIKFNFPFTFKSDQTV